MNNISKDKSKELLSAISKINKLAHNGFRKNNMSHREFMFLKAINYLKNNDDAKECPFKGVKASDLSKFLMVTKPAISKVINILEEKGFVIRIADNSDRRVVYINMTKAGEDILEKETEKFQEFTHRIVEKMGEEDTDEMIRLFKKMYDSIKEIEKEDSIKEEHEWEN
ncbi:MarR family transcriptional regulator [Romboutsia sp. CE17]|uniref:MarR family winged helix-turn-helix transcriptional regulator n=1 Tax=Romboutsia sp. CE17 TaxID=2724150 RepID=UPI001442B5E7|nr:MarR family transcriptional regulator [Romboutsia sp. CE17]QJA07780.1 MarR family transcriptional regulator [Romboutsia sp. CE17]